MTWLRGLLLLAAVLLVSRGLMRPVSAKRFQAMVPMPDLADCALE